MRPAACSTPVTFISNLRSESSELIYGDRHRTRDFNSRYVRDFGVSRKPKTKVSLWINRSNIKKWRWIVRKSYLCRLHLPPAPLSSLHILHLGEDAWIVYSKLHFGCFYLPLSPILHGPVRVRCLGRSQCISAFLTLSFLLSPVLHHTVTERRC